MNFVKKNSTELKFFAVFFIFAAALTQCSASPLIYPDEAGYIGWVYKIIYGHGDGLRYLPGYSILITPAFLATDGIRTAFMLVTLINSALYGAFSAVCVKLAKKLELQSPLLCAAAVSLYPSFVLYANLALSEVLLTLLFAVILYSITEISENIASKSAWAALLFFSAYACTVHSRAIVLIPAVFAAIAPLIFKKGSRAAKILLTVCFSAGVLGAAGLFFYLLSHSETVNAAHMLHQIENLFTLRGIFSFVTTLAAQFSYLAMSTFGFIIIGIYYAIKAVHSEKTRTAALFSLAALLLSALVSAVFMYHHERPDHVIYGRYNEYAIAGVMLFGISGFLKNRAKLYLAVYAAFSGIATAVFCSEPLKDFGSNLCHTWGIYLYKAFFCNFSYISVFVLFAAVSAVIFIIKKPKFTVIALCVLFAAGTLYTEYDYFYKGAQPRQQYPQLSRILDGEKTVSADIIEGDSMVYPWEYYNYTVYNPKLSIKEGSKYILSQKRLPGMTLAGKEKNSSVYLYASGGTAVDEAGEPDASVELTAHDNGYIAVTYKNLGAPWLCLDAADTVTGAVRGGMRVYKDGKLIDDVRRDFTDNVYGSAGVIFEFPYEDGEYDVIIETVREFRYRGGELSLKAVVSDGKLEISESNKKISAGFTEFDPAQIKGAEGFYRYYVTSGGAKIPGIYLSGTYLSIETYGEHGELDVEAFGNGKPLKFIKFEDNSYIFEMSEPIETLEIKSSTYKYCYNGMSFLTTESNVKAVDYFVRGMKKLFDVRLDHRDYGVDIKKICVN